MLKQIGGLKRMTKFSQLIYNNFFIKMTSLHHLSTIYPARNFVNAYPIYKKKKKSQRKKYDSDVFSCQEKT